MARTGKAASHIDNYPSDMYPSFTSAFYPHSCPRVER